jgi:hypothetical protein
VDVGHRSGHPDVLVVHGDARSARRSIERLSRAGVDGGDIILLGRAEVVTAGRHADRQVDLGSSLALGGRVLRGALIGCLPGAVFGAFVLGLAAGTDVSVLLAGAGGGALFGASVGILVGLLSTPTMAGSWERTFAPMVPGGIAIGVRIADQRGRRRVDRALRGSGAVTVREVSDLDDLPHDPRESSIDG